MAKKHRVHIAHGTRGRVRVKAPSAKGDREALRELSQAFANTPGVQRVEINETTGSVVLYYDPAHHDVVHEHLQEHTAAPAAHRPPPTELDELAHRIEEEAEFLAQNSATAHAVVDFVKQVDHQIKLATNNNVDFKILLAAGLIGVTVLEIGASAATPVWVTLTLFALNHFIEMHPAPDRKGARPAFAPAAP